MSNRSRPLIDGGMPGPSLAETSPAKRSGRCPRTLEPQHLVGEPEHEVATGRIGDESAEALLTLSFRRRDRRLRCPEQSVGPGDRPLDAFGVS